MVKNVCEAAERVFTACASSKPHDADFVKLSVTQEIRKALFLASLPSRKIP